MNANELHALAKRVQNEDLPNALKERLPQLNWFDHSEWEAPIADTRKVLTLTRELNPKEGETWGEALSRSVADGDTCVLQEPKTSYTERSYGLLQKVIESERFGEKEDDWGDQHKVNSTLLVNNVVFAWYRKILTDLAEMSELGHGAVEVHSEEKFQKLRKHLYINGVEPSDMRVLAGQEFFARFGKPEEEHAMLYLPRRFSKGSDGKLTEVSPHPVGSENKITLNRQYLEEPLWEEGFLFSAETMEYLHNDYNEGRITQVYCREKTQSLCARLYVAAKPVHPEFCFRLLYQVNNHIQ